MYLDPGVGGMLVQIIIAIVAVGGAIVFSMRKKIKGFFMKNKTAKPRLDSSAENDDELIDVLGDTARGDD